MTTEPQPNTEGEWIPRYFSDFRREFDSFKDENARQFMDFVRENARQHEELSGRISGLEVRIAQMEARLMWRGLGGLALIGAYGSADMRLCPPDTHAGARLFRLRLVMLSVRQAQKHLSLRASQDGGASRERFLGSARNDK